MRFKTRLNVDQIPHFLRIMQGLDKIERRCVLHLCASDVNLVRIVIQADHMGSVAAFANLKRSEWFESYRIESQNENQIGLEMDMQNLLRALRSAAAADEIVVKLAKKGVPVLAFEIRTPLGPILQDIPVVVLSRVRLAEFNEPDYENVKGFTLPPLANLHTVVDRMKGLSNHLHITAKLSDQRADLTLSVMTETTSVSTSYSDLSVASYTENDNDNESLNPSSETTVEALVELKSFSKCLYGHQAQPKHAVCCVLPSCVMVHLIIPSDVLLTYYLPRRVTKT